MWLEVEMTNKNLAIVAKHFVNCIQQIDGTPCIAHADYGTENVRVAALQRFFRSESEDAFS